MTRQKLNSFRSNQIEVSYLVLVSKSKEMCRKKFPEIRSLSYFKRINGLEFWCLQIPLKVVTFWDEPKLAKSCPANFVPLKKFRVQNNEHVTPSPLSRDWFFEVLSGLEAFLGFHLQALSIHGSKYILSSLHCRNLSLRRLRFRCQALKTSFAKRSCHFPAFHFSLAHRNANISGSAHKVQL